MGGNIVGDNAVTDQMISPLTEITSPLDEMTCPLDKTNPSLDLLLLLGLLSNTVIPDLEVGMPSSSPVSDCSRRAWSLTELQLAIHVVTPYGGGGNAVGVTL